MWHLTVPVSRTMLSLKKFLCFCVFIFLWFFDFVGEVGGRTGNRRFLAASRPNPAPGGLGKGPGRFPSGFAPIFRSADQL